MKKKIALSVSIIGLILIIGFFLFKKPSVTKIKNITGSKTERDSAYQNIPEKLIRPKRGVERCPERIKVGDLDMPLLFGENVSEELKQFILKDINLLYGSLEEYKIYDWKKVNKRHVRNLQINNNEYLTSKRVIYSRAHAPKVLHKNFGDIITDNGIEKILIPNEIVEAYEKAYTFKKKHSREYEELANFVYMITEADEETPIPLHPRDFLYMPGAPILEKIENEPGIVPEAQRFYSKTTRLRMPSVLEFYEAPESLKKYGINIYTKSYALKSDSNIPSTSLPIVYHDGFWKIYGSDGGG